MYARTLERLELAEELGASSVWLSEHHLFEDGYLPQPLSFAAAVAARTTRIRIGTAIVIAGLRPALDIAEQAALVDILSDGRLELGLGAGYRVPEFEAFGADAGRRFTLLEQRGHEVRRLLDESIAMPPAVQRPLPLWIGAGGSRGAAIAGRLGAGILSLRRRLLEPYRAGLEAAGHDPREGRMGGVVSLVLADNPEAAWSRIAPHLRYQRETYNRYGAEGWAARPGARPAVTVDVSSHAVEPEALRRPARPGRPPAFDVVTCDEAIRRLRRQLEGLPVSDVFLWASIAGMPDDLADRHVELLATRLAPALADVGIAVRS